MSMSALGADPIDVQLDKCDRALSAKIQEAQLCNLGVQLRTDEMARLNNENSELRKQGTSLLTNPFLWATIGVFVGVFAGARATR
jgi:hypothetical protein